MSEPLSRMQMNKRPLRHTPPPVREAMSDGADWDKSIDALYSQEEELNPLGHDIISRKLDTSGLVFADNLNWPSTRASGGG